MAFGLRSTSFATSCRSSNKSAHWHLYKSVIQSLIHPSIHLGIHPFIHLGIHPSIHPSIHPFIQNKTCIQLSNQQHAPVANHTLWQRDLT
eukprot:1100324-Pelagomonas_calceolata.AAC.2